MKKDDLILKFLSEADLSSRALSIYMDRIAIVGLIKQVIRDEFKELVGNNIVATSKFLLKINFTETTRRKMKTLNELYIKEKESGELEPREQKLKEILEGEMKRFLFSFGSVGTFSRESACF